MTPPRTHAVASLLLCALVGACDETPAARPTDPGERDLDALDADPMCLMHDLNGDFRVDTEDLVEIAAVGFGAECPECRADLDGNGVIETDDLVELMAAGGFGPDGTGRICTATWAFYGPDAIADRTVLTLAGAVEHYEPDLSAPTASAIAAGEVVYGAIAGLDRPILHDDGVFEVPPGWLERVDAYASGWGEQGDDYRARYIEGLIQFGGLDPAYAPHQQLIQGYLAHTTGELPDDGFRDGGGTCQATCTIALVDKTHATLDVDEACGEHGSTDAAGGEAFGGCLDVDDGGSVTAHHTCTWDFDITPMCVFVPSEPGACSQERIGAKSCDLHVEFSGTGEMWATAERDNYGEPGNEADGGSRMKMAVTSEVGPGQQSSGATFEESLVASVMDADVWQAWGEKTLESTYQLLRKCNYSVAVSAQGVPSVGMVCNGGDVIDTISALFKYNEELVRGLVEAIDHASGKVEVEIHDFPGYQRHLTLENGGGDDTGLGNVRWSNNHRFRADGEIESYVSASSSPDAGGSMAWAEAAASASYRLTQVETNDPLVNGNPFPDVPTQPLGPLQCTRAPARAPDLIIDANDHLAVPMSCAHAPTQVTQGPVSKPEWLERESE